MFRVLHNKSYTFMYTMVARFYVYDFGIFTFDWSIQEKSLLCLLTILIVVLVIATDLTEEVVIIINDGNWRGFRQRVNI